KPSSTIIASTTRPASGAATQASGAVAAITTATGAGSASSTRERPEGTTGDFTLAILPVRRSRMEMGRGRAPAPGSVEGRGGAAAAARRGPPSPAYRRRHLPIASRQEGLRVGRSLRRLGLLDEPGHQLLDLLALDLGCRRQQQAVAQGRHGERLDVV